MRGSGQLVGMTLADLVELPLLHTRNYEVLASTNLIDWAPIGLMLPKDQLFGYLDRDATNFVYRFYQARQVPPAAP